MKTTSKAFSAGRACCLIASAGLCCSLLTVSLAATATPPGHASVDGAMLNRIADAGFNHGEVVETAAYLADRIGGRMTNSPAMRVAERWTQDRFKSWGLKNVRTEAFDFGRGWWIESSHVRMLTPRPLELFAIPVAWTPATNGPLAAPIVVAPMRTEKDFPEWKGKLAGKIVLITWPEPPKDNTEPPFTRLSDQELAKLNEYVQPKFDPEARQRLIDRVLFRRKVDAFLASEGAVASAVMSRSDKRLIHGEGYSYQVGRTLRLPQIEISAEDYRRLARLAKVGEVRLEIDSNVHFDDSDHNGYDVFADIPGKEPKGGYVMAGAHLDSWVAGDGAADNGAGSAIVMEASRILASLGVQPKRTIRFALWAGEEQGLIGSSAFVNQHLAHRPTSKDPEAASLGPYFGGADQYPVEPLPGYKELAGYFNVDNGSGKFRGIYAEGNFAAAPILKQWLAPFESMGAGTVVAEPTDSTDHQLMSEIGLPAFQFIQDPLDYETTVHHTDVDTFDHLRAEDLRQASVILAAVLLDAANLEQPLPGKPLPTEPRLTDPFHYREPSKPQ
jgi:carboxypeptidase Q